MLDFLNVYNTWRHNSLQNKLTSVRDEMQLRTVVVSCELKVYDNPTNIKTNWKPHHTHSFEDI